MMATGEKGRWSWLGVAGAVVLGLVFLVAAYGKALDPVAFAEQIAAEGLDFLLPAGVVAWAAVVLEVALGLALVLAVRRAWVLVPTGLLIALFLFLTGRAYWRYLNGIEDGAHCGCFGNLIDRTPAEAFWQDLFLLLPAFVLVCLWPGPERLARWKIGLVAVAAVAAGLFVWRAPNLPLDDLATRLRPGVAVAGLCAGSPEEEEERVCLDLVLPELGQGRHLVVIDGLESKELIEQIPRLNELARGGEPLGVYLVNDAPADERNAFFWSRAPGFELREVPEPLLRPLYRTQPRVFLVEDGIVTRTWAAYPAAGEV